MIAYGVLKYVYMASACRCRSTISARDECSTCAMKAKRQHGARALLALHACATPGRIAYLTIRVAVSCPLSNERMLIIHATALRAC